MSSLDIWGVKVKFFIVQELVLGADSCFYNDNLINIVKLKKNLSAKKTSMIRFWH